MLSNRGTDGNPEHEYGPLKVGREAPLAILHLGMVAQLVVMRMVELGRRTHKKGVRYLNTEDENLYHLRPC